MNGADILCDSLLTNGVDTCFANPGTSEMHFVAALDRKPAMRCVLGLFEGVVTGAADGYARMLDRPAATLLHLGPGLANGLANLHNARQARTPMVNIVGDHATYHADFDTPLRSDIVGIARTMSHWVHKCMSVGTLSAATALTIEKAGGAHGSIATLILPADVAWAEAHNAPIAIASKPVRSMAEVSSIEAVANCLRKGATSTLLLGGGALRERPLEVAGRIARATGARLLTETSNARMQRGGGRTPVGRLPYNVDDALRVLSGVETMVLVGSKEPIASFAYPGKPSKLLPSASNLLTLARPEDDALEVLEAVADALGIHPHAPGLVCQARLPELPQSESLTGAAVCRIVANLLPEGAIIVDESISQGREFGMFSEAAPEHDWLQLTGGAIGQGLPVATGAAIACPGRKVISLQADGSAMYTVQSLWTQAREMLGCVTVILSNRSYGTLHLEMKKVGATAVGRNSSRMLDLDAPCLDWVSMAKGMGVDAMKATTIDELVKGLKYGLAIEGPFLIEASI